jgi:hypothetical protein
MTSRLNNPNASLTFGNVNTHIFTEFSTMNKESTQKEVLQAIKDINISAEIGEITVESSDTITHTKLDTLNTTVSNKHLNSTTDSVSVGNFPSSFEVSNFPASTEVSNFPASTEVSNFPTSTEVSNFPSSFEVSNFPSSFEVSNFPTSTEVSNFPTSTEVSNFPTSTEVSNFPTSTEVSNFPTSTEVSNFPTSTEVSNFPTSTEVSNFPTDTAKEAKQDIQIEELQKIVNKTGDIAAEIPFGDGSQVWADTTPIPIQNPNSPLGWAYVNASTGNAINLYYFNGNNETKTLNQVVGQYAVVSNLATVLNNKMIFGIYTKGSPFFTTRITHSPPSGVDMIAGGRYLLYWGDVPEDIFSNLPRLNFSVVGTTGAGNPSEEILSVTLNSDSSATAGSVIILIESLGVVFSNGSVNQSRVYNLISNTTEYRSLTNLNDKIQTTDNGVNSYIINYPASQTINGEVSVSSLPAIEITNTGFNVNNFPEVQTIDGSVSVSSLPAIEITNTGFNVNNFPEVQTIDGSVSVSSLPAIEITNTGFDVNNQISNYALEADGNLEEIRNKTDNFNFNDNSGVLELNVFDIQNNAKLDTIETYTSKLDDLTYTDNNLNVNIASGTLSVDSVKIQASNGDNLTATGTSLNTNITNSSIDTHCYASPNGTNWHHLSSDANGQLNIHSKTQDGNGTDITSTDLLNSKRGLDTASSLFGYAGSTRTALSCDIGGKLLISSYTADDLGNGITSSATSTSVRSLDTASSLYVSNGTARTALTATGSSLNANITNTVPVSGTFFQATQPVSIASTVPVSGTFFQTTQPVSLKDGSNNLLTSTDTTATQRSLDTASCLYTTDATTRSALTSTAISSIRALDVNVANSSVPVTFSNTTIGISGTASVSDTTSQGYLNNINNAIGDRPSTFALGNLINNGSLTATTFSTEQTFTKGEYRRNTLIFYRDSNISNTGSISVYSSTTSGTPSSVLLGTFFPISNGTFRQFTGTFNLLPFASLFIRNDSDTTISSVYVSYVNG